MWRDLVLVALVAFALLSNAAHGQATVPTQQLRITRDIEYVRRGEQSLKLDLYVPGDLKQAAPCVVWIHGGAWRAEAPGSRLFCLIPNSERRSSGRGLPVS